jgi:hypothetical protein
MLHKEPRYLLANNRQELIFCSVLHSSDISIADPLHALDFAKVVSEFCHEKGIRILLIDGPQAWKDPDSKWVHCRACEKELATPAKTGAKGMVKPHTWTRFVVSQSKFSISLSRTSGHGSPKAGA